MQMDNMKLKGEVSALMERMTNMEKTNEQVRFYKGVEFRNGLELKINGFRFVRYTTLLPCTAVYRRIAMRKQSVWLGIGIIGERFGKRDCDIIAAEGDKDFDTHRQFNFMYV